MRDGTDIVVLDSRPFDEYRRVSIPTATSVPGAELVLRVRDIAPSPDTLVVVNCAGRTRSIIGAQSLINAGVPNKVVALRNGTMGWSLAGSASTAARPNGSRRPPPKAWPGRRPRRTRGATLWRQRISPRRSNASAPTTRARLYLFDVRDPPEYFAGHVAGAISAPGGQLVQATDQYAGTLGARIVLVDDAEVRAAMTASWLRQMGWKDVFVLVETGRETGGTAAPVLGPALPSERASTAASLPTCWAATLPPSSISRSVRTIARVTFRAHGSPSARGFRGRCRKFR